MDYSELAMEHFQRPRNVGELDEHAPQVGTGIAAQDRCGDVVKLQLRFDAGRVTEVRFKAFGCAAAVAAGSLATELAQGRGAPWLLALDDDALADRLSMPPSKRPCAALAVRALRDAVADWQAKSAAPPDPAAPCTPCCGA
jgi:nitrogen fixation NifU-like protein